jgi:hypothetical protein
LSTLRPEHRVPQNLVGCIGDLAPTGNVAIHFLIALNKAVSLQNIV